MRLPNPIWHFGLWDIK